MFLKLANWQNSDLNFECGTYTCGDIKHDKSNFDTNNRLVRKLNVNIFQQYTVAYSHKVAHQHLIK